MLLQALRYFCLSSMSHLISLAIGAVIGAVVVLFSFEAWGAETLTVTTKVVREITITDESYADYCAWKNQDIGRCTIDPEEFNAWLEREKR